MIKLNEIKSISIDISTEKAPYNRIYAKPIEKQGDVLLCEFESANYDIEQKALKEENTKLKSDCRTLVQKLLQVKPELREWLEKNYGEYL